METIAIIWFCSMLVGAGSLIVAGEVQKSQQPPTEVRPTTFRPTPSPEAGWKKTGQGDTEVRVYWKE
jgi:hypothetical protein